MAGDVGVKCMFRVLRRRSRAVILQLSSNQRFLGVTTPATCRDGVSSPRDGLLSSIADQLL